MRWLIGASLVALAACSAPRATERRRPEIATMRPGEVLERRSQVVGKDPGGCTWLESFAIVSVGERESENQARAASIEQARAAAIQDFLGVDIQSRSMDFLQESLRGEARLTEGLLQTTRNGRILKETLISGNYQDVPGCPSCRRYAVKLRTCVIPRPSSADKDFRVSIRVSQTNLIKGDEAKLTVSATRDCYVYIYNVYDLGGFQDKTALLVPDSATHEKRMRAGETWTYPDVEARTRGTRMIAEMAHEGDNASAEVVRVIATKGALSKEIYDPVDGGWLGVLRRLYATQFDWADDADGFTIYRR